MIDDIVTNIEATLTAAAKRGREFLEESELDTRIDELREKTERVVREHPYETIFIGAIVGMIIGRLFTRKD
jgi:ElaB/YqjD/DUF883 family membrane-anchored ribosome-binding protein